jgi:hypothetical protein
MTDFFITREEQLSSLRPSQLACGLDVANPKWKLSSRGLELLEKEMTRREEEWVDKGGAQLGSLLAFAACPSFTRNLAGITLAFAQTKSKTLNGDVPFVVWEASLFLWMNLIEPQLLGETLQSLSDEVLRQLLYQFGRLLLSAATYPSQELVMEILLKIRAFYMQQVPARGSEVRDQLSWVNHALPSHVRSELPSTANATATYGSGRPPYRRWINLINAKNPLVTTTPFQTLSCDFEIVSTKAHLQYERGAGYLDLCPMQMFLFLTGDATLGEEVDAFLRLPYSDIVKAYFECDSAGHVQTIKLHLSQPSELCRFFSLGTSDAVAHLKMVIPLEAAAAAARFREALHSQLQREEEKIEDELTAPSARPKISRADSRSVSLQRGAATGREFVAATKMPSRPRDDTESDVSSPLSVKATQAAHQQTSARIKPQEQRRVEEVQATRADADLPRPRMRAEALLTVSASVGKRGLSEVSMNSQRANLELHMQDSSKKHRTSTSLSMETSALQARVPLERENVPVPRQTLGHDENLAVHSSLSLPPLPATHWLASEERQDGPSEWYMLSSAEPEPEAPRVDLGFMPSTSMRHRVGASHWEGGSPREGITSEADKNGDEESDELEVRIKKLISHCIALRERDRLVAIRREQDHARARANEQMASYLGEWKAMRLEERVLRESALLLQTEVVVQQLAALRKTVQNELSYCKTHAQELESMRKSQVNTALRAASEAVKALQHRMSKEEEEFRVSLTRRTSSFVKFCKNVLQSSSASFRGHQKQFLASMGNADLEA